MRLEKTSQILTLALAIIFFFPAVGSGLRGEDRVVYEKELKRIAQGIRDAVLKKDIKTLSKYKLNDEKSDPTYETNENLENPKSFRYCYLFDTLCLKEMAAKYSGQRNPFLKTSILDFLKKKRNLSLSVLFWPQQKNDSPLIASVVFFNASYKIRQEDILRKGWPYNDWGKDFVACDFVLIQGEWKYYDGVFTVGVDEGDVG